MTRINVGIDPHELCDQHLRSEYRELPRLWNFTSKKSPPPQFKLGKGHLLWCSQYRGMLADRYIAIVIEMRARNFTVNFPDPPPDSIHGRRPTQEELNAARFIILHRLNERYTTMKRPPKWTKIPCTPPPQGIY
jgi:hypothetical protein